MQDFPSTARAIARRRAYAPALVLLHALASLAALLVLALPAAASGIERFVGDYSGSAPVLHADGSTEHRDMSVSISETRDGFLVAWTTTTEKQDGRRKSKSYEIEFHQSPREGIYAAAQKRNVFGHSVQLDPMKGEPYVWGRINGETLSVYSLFVTPSGDYEMQQFDRTLTDGGLQLVFSAEKGGDPKRTVETFLKRE